MLKTRISKISTILIFVFSLFFSGIFFFATDGGEVMARRQAVAAYCQGNCAGGVCNYWRGC